MSRCKKCPHFEFTRGIRNKNPFNIRKSKSRWIGKIKGTDKEFESFDTLEHGYRAGLILLANYYKKYKLHTYRQILTRFAPPSENRLDLYLDWIHRKSDIDPDEYISLKLLLYEVAPLIAYYESRFSDDDIIYDVTDNICKLYKL